MCCFETAGTQMGVIEADPKNVLSFLLLLMLADVSKQYSDFFVYNFLSLWERK